MTTLARPSDIPFKRRCGGHHGSSQKIDDALVRTAMSKLPSKKLARAWAEILFHGAISIKLFRGAAFATG